VRILGIAVLALAILPAEPLKPEPPSLPAAPSGCVLVAKADIWVNVYQEQDPATKGAVILTDVHLKDGETQRVTGVRNDRIVYNTRLEATDPPGGDIHADCLEGAKLFIP
jgi:hypothetical protein